MNFLTQWAPLALLFCAPLPFAETITGTILDAAGNPVAGVDIDVDNLGSGGDPDIFNDGTDAAGNFTTTIVGAGLYDIVLTPPPPPTSTAVPIRLHDVLVIGTTDLGVITLPPGVSVGGTLLNSSGLPVSSVNIDVRDANGANQIVRNDRSDLFGNFLVTVPAGASTLELLTHTVFLETLVPRRFDLQTSTNLDLGTITLDPGFHVTGKLTQPGGAGLAQVDLDVFNSASGVKIFTPGDNTSLTGAFDLVLPAGTFDVEWCPPIASRLVAHDVEGVVVAADVPLGTFVTEAGSLFSGAVFYDDGTPAQAVDLDVLRANGTSVVTCGDDTNALGFYQVVLPHDTLAITYSPPGARTRFERAQRNVTLVDDLVLNVELQPCGPCGGTRGAAPGSNTSLYVDPYLAETITYGIGVSGTGGVVPRIAFEGPQPSIVDNQFRLFVEGCVGGGVAFLASALRPDLLPIAGGYILVEPFTPFVDIPLYLDGLPGEPGVGSAEFVAGQLPISALGLRVYCQFLVQDSGGEYGFALSDAIRFVIRHTP